MDRNILTKAFSMKSLGLLAILCGISAVLSLPTDRSGDLFTLDLSLDMLDVASCDDDDIISCVYANVNPDAINADQIMVEGTMWTKVEPLQDEVTDESFSAEFSTSDGSTAVFTVRGRDMFGSVEMADGSVYLLENCGEDCHVWMELDTDLEEEGYDELDNHNDDNENQNRRNRWYTDLQNQGKEDETTIAEFSVMIYYTPEFAAETPDVQTYVDAVIAETNEGYINSKIPIRAKVHCIELAEDLHDMEDGVDMIYKFQDWGGSNIRRSADAAALLVADFNVCGIGFMAAYRYQSTITVSQKSCALRYYTFGHELGHNFGTTHDKINGQNSRFSYGYGKHIGPKYLGGGRGWRTIMAYNEPGYGQKTNYYSNPDVQFLGHDTGSADEDSARVITENRFVFAAIGDESETCAAPTPAPTTQAPAPTTDAPAPTTEAPAPTTEAPAPSTEAPTAIPTSAYMNNECKDGTEVRGRNLEKPKRAADWYECQQRCLSKDGCNWFSYYTKQFKKKGKRGKCFLKKNMKKIKKKKGAFSGPKTCYT